MRKLLIFLSLIIGFIASARAIEVQAPQVYMVDFDTGVVLFEKNADQKMVPSSILYQGLEKRQCDVEPYQLHTTRTGNHFFFVG